MLFEEQDLGDLTTTVRSKDEVSTRRNIDVLYPDSDKEHIDAMEGFRDVIEENYSEKLDELADDGERVIITRLIVVSDDIPMIEYAVVDER